MSDFSILNVDWFYGSTVNFKNWKLPFPTTTQTARPGLLYSSERSIAAKSGSRLAVARLHADAKVINALTDENEIEQMRIYLLSHPIFSRSINVDKDFWHAGWLTGESLRFQYSDDSLEQHFYRTISSEAEENDIHPREMKERFFETLNSNFFSEICFAIKTMGYDGICFNDGLDVEERKTKALVLTNSHVMTPPEWISK